MSASQQKMLFAIDPGANNWCLNCALREGASGHACLLSEPAPSRLTTLFERSLPDVLVLESTPVQSGVPPLVISPLRGRKSRARTPDTHWTQPDVYARVWTALIFAKVRKIIIRAYTVDRISEWDALNEYGLVRTSATQELGRRF